MQANQRNAMKKTAAAAAINSRVLRSGCQRLGAGSGRADWLATAARERSSQPSPLPRSAHAPHLGLNKSAVAVACLEHARPTLHWRDAFQLSSRVPRSAAGAGRPCQPDRIRPPGLPRIRLPRQSRGTAAGELPQGLARSAPPRPDRFAAPAPRRACRPLPTPPLGPAGARAARRAGQRGGSGRAATQLGQQPAARQTWNELVAAEHPHGAVLHVGAQLRYLIESEHGLLGALGFAASALALAARDALTAPTAGQSQPAQRRLPDSSAMATGPPCWKPIRRT